MTRYPIRPLAAAVAMLAVLCAQAQETPAGYIPLFSAEQIANATSDEARQRMTETEERNRTAWMERQKRLEAEQSKPEDTRTAEADATVSRSAGRKIYRWVDAEGRVNFGDMPPARGREEVTLKGTAPARASAGAPSLRPAGDKD